MVRLTPVVIICVCVGYLFYHNVTTVQFLAALSLYEWSVAVCMLDFTLQMCAEELHFSK